MSFWCKHERAYFLHFNISVDYKSIWTANKLSITFVLLTCWLTDFRILISKEISFFMTKKKVLLASWTGWNGWDLCWWMRVSIGGFHLYVCKHKTDLGPSKLYFFQCSIHIQKTLIVNCYEDFPAFDRIWLQNDSMWHLRFFLTNMSYECPTPWEIQYKGEHV